MNADSDEARLLIEAEVDILANMAFPQSHWRRIYSANPLERLNKEVKRRTNVVGVFPDRDSVIRLVGSLLMEADDEWQIGRRYFSQASMKELLEPKPLADAKALPMRCYRFTDNPVVNEETHVSKLHHLTRR